MQTKQSKQSKIIKQTKQTQKEKNSDNKKIKLGQFFTTKSSWLKEHIKEFIINSNCHTILDPFAGNGDLLKTCKENIPNITNIIGYDIDKSLNWEYNNSLIDIPKVDNSLIVTNPPYISKDSATKKNIIIDEFKKTNYTNIYMLALDKMLDKYDNVVAIIPESFIVSNYMRKNRLVSITIIEDNIFTDTEVPICVVCFDKNIKSYKDISIYKNDEYIDNYQNILNFNLEPKYNIPIKFNTSTGWLVLKAFDSVNANNRIKFYFKEDVDYNWEHVDSIYFRFYTLIDINIPKIKRQEFINKCNEELEVFRDKTKDILLLAFMGNTNQNKRRRRLSFHQARALLENVYIQMSDISYLF